MQCLSPGRSGKAPCLVHHIPLSAVLGEGEVQTKQFYPSVTSFDILDLEPCSLDYPLPALGEVKDPILSLPEPLDELPLEV